MSLIFTPILKTKRVSEYHALEEIIPLLADGNILPYIEGIKEFTHSNVRKYISLLDKYNSIYFYEPKRDELLNIYKSNATSSNCILSMFLYDDIAESEVEDFINYMHASQRRCAIKLKDGDDRFLPLLHTLTAKDYLIIELGGTSYYSSSFISDIKDIGLNSKIIIHSNERFQNLRGKDFEYYDYNNPAKFNFSVIDSIKNSAFNYDGFGSRCSAKNDLIEENKLGEIKVKGVFLIYDYQKNNFFSIQSDKEDIVARIYNDVKNRITINRADLDARFFNATPISKNLLDKYLSASKFSSSKVISVAIVRYIEEINKNIL